MTPLQRATGERNVRALILETARLVDKPKADEAAEPTPIRAAPVPLGGRQTG